MGGIGLVTDDIVEHGIERGDERRSFSEAGENRAVANRRIDHEGRPLRHLESVKFCRALPDARFDLGGLSALDQLL